MIFYNKFSINNFSSFTQTMVFYVQLPKCTFDIDKFSNITLFDDSIYLHGKSCDLTIYKKDIESEFDLEDLYYDLGEYLNRYEDASYFQLPKITFNIYDYDRIELDEKQENINLYNNNRVELVIPFSYASSEYETLQSLYEELSDTLMELNEYESDEEEPETDEEPETTESV